MSVKFAMKRKMALSIKIAHLSYSSSTKFSVALLVAILGLVVQMQLTPEFGGTKVRFNLADPIVAIVMPLVLYATLRNWRNVKNQLGWYILALFACATFVFSYAYAIGYWETGFFTWSAVKYVGWYVLMAYFAMGAFCIALLGKTGQKHFAFAFFWACVVFALVQILLLYFSKDDTYFSLVRFQGFSGNPNAYGFVLICGFVLGVVYKEEICHRFFKGSAELLCAIVLAGIYFTGSISALLTIMVVFGLLLIGIVPWKQLTLIVVLALVIVFTPSITGTYKPGFTTAVFKNKISSSLSAINDIDGISGSKTNTIYHQTIGARIDAMWQGFELWQQSPAFGAGLGVHLFQQQNNAAEEKPIVLVHNTALWLLAGTGLVGLLVFVLLFTALVKKMWCNAKADAGTGPPLRPGNFASAALICMVAWLFMSQFHELMYQRPIWLIVGMAMWPVANKQKQ